CFGEVLLNWRSAPRRIDRSPERPNDRTTERPNDRTTDDHTQRDSRRPAIALARVAAPATPRHAHRHESVPA
ncbi:hypothetical protein, partial [Burkholderia sp. AU12872]|uniref:hypothetical protein n=1 Tax=Burkholderia sp. AU12872 TaxID=2171707 RepID=UPI001A9C8E77